MSDSQFDNLKKWGADSGVPEQQAQPAPPPGAVPTTPAPAPPIPTTPRAWFAAKYPALETRFGAAVEEVWPDEESGKRPYVKDLCEDFLAATLGEDAGRYIRLMTPLRCLKQRAHRRRTPCRLVPRSGSRPAASTHTRDRALAWSPWYTRRWPSRSPCP